MLLEAFSPDDPPPRIEDLAIPFTAVAVDFLSGREEVHFSSGPLITALAASIAVPAIIKPVELDGRILIDGGAANPMPHDVAGAHGDPVIASDVIGLRSPKSGGLPTPAESVYGAAVILMQSVMKAKAAASRFALLAAPGTTATLFDFFKAG
ncbi:MAG: patatin-like phospholipase family protein [Tepidamorphaceae bacterium]